MQWESLTALGFEKAVQRCKGVGISPVGLGGGSIASTLAENAVVRLDAAVHSSL